MGLSALFFLFILGSCNEPSTLGSDIVEDDMINLKTDTNFTFETKTVVREPFVVFGGGTFEANTVLLGHTNDPLVGETTIELFSQLDFVARKGNPFDGATIDSVCLFMRYDTFGNYGDFTLPVSVEVFELMENLDFEETYYNTKTFGSGVMKINEDLILDPPNPFDSVMVRVNDDSTTLAPARIRVKIDPNSNFVQKIVGLDSVFWAGRDTFRDEVPGLHIKLDAQNTMLGFNFRDILNTRLRFYFNYGKPDSTGIFSFFLDDGAVKSSYVNQTYNGTLAAQILDDSLTTSSDTITFLQELQGLSPKIKIQGLSKLEGTFINKAELELSVAVLEDDDPDMYDKPLLISAQEYGDSSIVDVIDTRIAKIRSGQTNSLTLYLNIFDGACNEVQENGEMRQMYRGRITSFLQSMIESGADEAEILISSFYRPESPRRVLFYGADSKHPPKLKVIYTDIE